MLKSQNMFDICMYTLNGWRGKNGAQMPTAEQGCRLGANENLEKVLFIGDEKYNSASASVEAGGRGSLAYFLNPTGGAGWVLRLGTPGFSAGWS